MMIVSTKHIIYAVFFSFFLWFARCSTRSSHDKLDRDYLATHGYTEVGDSLMVPPFEIDVKLSEAAQRGFDLEYETIVVEAVLYGIPDPSSGVKATQMGGVYMARPKIELQKAGVARFDQVKISKQVFASLIDKDFKVLITIASGGKSSVYNILNAEPIQQPISKMALSRHTVTAKSTRE